MVCEELDAELRGVLVQLDTYFQISRGRLKLREETGAVAQLIAYQRPDPVGQRESRYRIVEIERAEELKAALSDALGVRVVVVKERRLFLWREVRIHLDQVEGLGTFVEFEAPVRAGADLAEGEEQVQALREAFGIVDADVIGESYCDLVPNRPAAGAGQRGG